MPSFTDLLEAHGVLLADGGTGTNYQDMGIEPGVAPEEWIFGEPDRVMDLHRSFAEVGCDLISTCTFGASPVRLQEGPLSGRARDVNTRGAELARAAVGDDVLVAGSLGPTGQLTEPFGPLTKETALEAFAEQAGALADGGVDVLMLETFFTLDEGLWAAEAIRTVSDLPIVMSFSFDQGTRTMMGLSPADLTAAVDGLDLVALGANCGRSLQDNAQVAAEFLDAGLTAPLWIKPNAGVPQVTADGVVYPEDPSSFAAQVAEIAQRGARVVGGCCGSTPEHLAALAQALGR